MADMKIRDAVPSRMGTADPEPVSVARVAELVGVERDPVVPGLRLAG